MTSIRFALSLIAKYDLEVEQLHVKDAFLNGELEENIYMYQPEGYVVSGKENMVCKLQRSVYGLKQAPRQWYKRFDSFMLHHGFERILIDHCVYMKRKTAAEFIVLLLYVNDMLIMGKNANEIRNLKIKLNESFEMKDLGKAEHILAISCPLGTQFKMSTHLSPKNKAEQQVMEKIPYAPAIRSLIKEEDLVAYTDSDLRGDAGSIKSTFGYLFTYAGGAISWQSKLQKCIALSTTEAEYIVVTECFKEMLWLKRFFEELGLSHQKFIVQCDSQNAIHLCKNPSLHSRLKHIHLRYHWVREVLKEKVLQLEKVHTEDNGASMLTKVLPRSKHDTCCVIADLDTATSE
ncbi:transmembrane signal receptor [Lithospermum erythrorhizon]|uniref:Transmembrane signal receptor n=1 Tax=Lithospermum erythrorhizon TaxID=34254 RepID=A0AAV3RV43_LITER